MKDKADIQEHLEQVLAGDKEAFRYIVSECNQPLYRMAIAFMKNDQDAEDALQSTYMKAYQHLGSYRREAAFLTWITRILINECKMMLRRKKELASLDHSEVDEKRSLTENVVDTLHRNQLRGWLETAVLGLPEKYRLIYIAREVNEFSTEKTAEMLDITPENVKIRLHRAKSIIRESLLQQAPVQELFPFGNTHCQQLTDRVMDAIRKNH